MKPHHRKKARRRIERQLDEVFQRFQHWIDSGAYLKKPFYQPNGILGFKIQ